jgi:hypothetical protein
VVVNDATDCTAPEDGSIVFEFADFSSTGNATAFQGLEFIINGDANTAYDATYNAANNATLNAAGTTSFTIGNLAPDTYNVTINDITKGCISATYQFDINNVPTNPQMIAVIEADNFCW